QHGVAAFGENSTASGLGLAALLTPGFRRFRWSGSPWPALSAPSGEDFRLLESSSAGAVRETAAVPAIRPNEERPSPKPATTSVAGRRPPVRQRIGHRQVPHR